MTTAWQRTVQRTTGTVVGVVAAMVVLDRGAGPRLERADRLLAADWENEARQSAREG